MSMVLGHIPYENYSSWKSHLCHIYRHKPMTYGGMCSRCEKEWRDNVIERAIIYKIGMASPEDTSSSMEMSDSFDELS